MSAKSNAPVWLVAYDFSQCSRHALDVAAAELAGRGGTLVLFHAYDLPYVPVTMEWPGLESPIGSTAELERALDDESHIALEREARTIGERHPGLTVEIKIGRGAPADAIVAAATEVGAERIVVGTHGRAGIEHFLLGSVAENVVRHAKIPVLVLKAKEGEAS